MWSSFAISENKGLVSPSARGLEERVPPWHRAGSVCPLEGTGLCTMERSAAEIPVTGRRESTVPSASRGCSGRCQLSPPLHPRRWPSNSSQCLTFKYAYTEIYMPTILCWFCLPTCIHTVSEQASVRYYILASYLWEVHPFPICFCFCFGLWSLLLVT